MGYIHMKITGPDIAGESTDAGHAGEIELSSFAHAVSRTIGPRTTAGSASVGNSHHGDLMITKVIDKATPEIQKSICGGQQHKEVKIVVEKTNSVNGTLIPYMVYTLSDVIFSTSSIGGADGGGLPTESIGINYAKIKWEYTPTDPSTGDAQGVVPFAWDVSKNQVA
jgi:type VI secretion system secreted protein Hcp